MPVPTKRALIVDDSKSARVVLSRALEKLELSVDTTESAESALSYLRENRPDVIFMDQVMSGMDGLRAVQAIKSDPNTASIPIMMYTSQDGEIFAGEARAMGASGVLQKLAAPSDISKVLQQLEILADPDAVKSAIAEASAPVAPEAPAASSVAPPATAEVAAAPLVTPAAATAGAVSGLTLAEVRESLEPVFREQAADLRRFTVATLESVGARMITEVNAKIEAVAQAAATAAVAAMPVPPPPSIVVEAPPQPPAPRPVALMVTALAAALAALVVAGIAWKQHADIEQMRAAAATQSREIAAVQATLDTLRNASAVPPATAARLAVPYGEAPLAGERLATLGKLIADLARHGYAGRIRVTTSVGDFCLTGNPSEGYVTAPADMPANRCDVVGNPFDEALAPAGRMPPAVANFVSATAGRPQGPVEVVVTAAPRAPSQGVYPTATEVNAAEWNAAAARMNYVEYALEPRTPAQ